MKTVALLLFISFFLTECKKEEPDPGVNEAWFDATIADIEKSSMASQFYIVKADYEGTCVAYVNTCCPTCLIAIIPYRCDDGTKIENPDVTKLTNHQVIWKPKNFECNVE